MTKSQAIMAAVRQELDRRRILLDSTHDLYAVTITVKFDSRDSDRVRGINWLEERLNGARRQPPTSVP